jgi:hypothetical protein
MLAGGEKGIYFAQCQHSPCVRFPPRIRVMQGIVPSLKEKKKKESY